MNLLFVADGPRDEGSLLGLVQKILGKVVSAKFSAWVHLRNSGRGFEKKLRFALALTRSQKLHGMVAAVDRDRDRKNQRRLALKDCRSVLRGNGERLPIVLGVADPHVDVWLLDDPTAVRAGLGFSTDHNVPNALRVSEPKSALNEFISNSPIRDDDIRVPLSRIAEQVRIERCLHADKTGYAEFHSDCLNEFRQSIARG